METPITGERVAPSASTDVSTAPSESTGALGPASPPPARAVLVNFGGETVAECAARLLVDHERDGARRITAREAARLTAEGVAKSWRIVGNETMCDFYWHVAAHLTQTLNTEDATP